MEHAAHFGLAPQELHPAFGQLADRMSRLQHGSRLTLLTANGLWRQQGHPFTAEFLGLARTWYHAEAETADFTKAPGTAADRINAWIEGRTHGRIRAMLGQDALDLDTRLVLCNAIYFKGKWRSHFKVKETCPAPFFISESQNVSVPTMAQTAEFKTASIEEPAARLIELPYYGGDLGMVIILPEAVDGLAEMEKALTVENLGAWVARLDEASPAKTVVHLPRFTTRQKIDLIPTLRSLGVDSAFDDTRADFSGMDGKTNDLYLSSALHQAFVEVNEAGTEAAAVTFVGAKSRSQPRHFNADHPFVFLIRDRGSGCILFLGRLVDPTT